jgi:hypothetical protein
MVLYNSGRFNDKRITALEEMLASENMAVVPLILAKNLSALRPHNRSEDNEGSFEFA